MNKFFKWFSGFLLLILTVFIVTVQAKDNLPANMIKGASIRVKETDQEQGLRFKAQLNTSSEEYGFYLVYGTTTLEELENAVLETNDNKIILNGKKVFKVPVSKVDDNSNFGVVLTGVPESGYFQIISVFVYVDGKIIAEQDSTSVAKAAISQKNAGLTNSTIEDIITSLNIISVESFLSSTKEEALLQGIITHSGNYPYYTFEDTSGGISLLLNRDEGHFKKGDELLIKVKKDHDNELNDAEVISESDDIIVVSTNNKVENVNLNKTDLTSENLINYQSRLIELDNMYVQYKTESNNMTNITLMNSKGQTITLRWDNRVQLGEPNLVNILQRGRLVNLKGVSLVWDNEPVLVVDNNNQLSLSGLTYPEIKIVGEDNVNVGEDLILEASLTFLDGPVTWKSSDTSVLTVQDGVVQGLKTGTATVTAIHNGFTSELEVVVADPNAKLEFTFTDDYEELTTINWNKPFDPLKGLKVYDSLLGDITDQVVITNPVDNQSYGLQTMTLTIENSFGKTATLERSVEVVWDYDITFIGHAGSYYGLMNSEEAILYAIQVLKYQAIEVDLKQTRDGVFILSHDDDFGGYTLNQTNWSTLKDVTVTKGRNAGLPSQNGSITNSPYTASLLTLERYLEICKENNVDAVIELKYSAGINNSDQSRMQAFMDIVEEKDMLDNVVLLGSQYNCLIWTRENNYENVRCQYLVSSIASDSTLQRCLDYNFDISLNVNNAANTDEWIAKYKANNIKVAVYTFSQYSDYNLLQSWIDKGVDFVTVDWHLMSEVNLPETNKEPLETYEVTFKNYDGTVLSVVEVEEGSPALEPRNLKRLGYEFTGWDESVVAVFKDLVVTAQYEISVYTITYDPNIGEATLVEWENKAAFTDEFYNDFYDWLFAYGKDLPGITISGNSLTITLSGVTTTIGSVADLKNVSIYDFEKTFGTLIYKPFIRVSDKPVVMDVSNEYFLNTNPYRTKYQDLDRWFLNTLINSYQGYDRGYNHASNGRVQIMFRFQQWQQGTSIAQFNIIPQKTLISGDINFEYELPTTYKTYTVLDEFDLPVATGDKEFLGWYLDSDLKTPLTKILKGRTENIILYAKWGN